ncbi:EamA family transporter RarD [Sphingomonas sp. QA11]|uniref:EamA family transporter RarD n=1 Tax=Sphingomonas sp. QA11 TaxID=2950605 RepID=UPI002349480B|nr:EamA family transporter RarD [Sphingomonas sp. QA11]WCM27253.1 EamA family transporter RarD [Sphingomonas sp. QA11]
MTDRAPSRPALSPEGTGVMLGAAAYVFWGVLPLYLRLLRHVPAGQILAHRVLWSVVMLVVVTLLFRRVRTIVASVTWRTLLLLSASASLIALNWLVYIWAVQNAHVLDASLGYFINPLVNVALGVIVLSERVRRTQWVAIALAALGVAVMALSNGGSIWISLALALTFGFYGLIRKVVAIDALGGLLIETILLAPFAFGLLLVAHGGGEGVFGREVATDLLLILAGAVTAAPLLLFAGAARRMPYAALGLLQYIAPTLQFLIAIFVFGEHLRPHDLAAFGLIWIGLAVYAADGIRTGRAARASAAPEPAAR